MAEAVVKVREKRPRGDERVGQERFCRTFILLDQINELCCCGGCVFGFCPKGVPPSPPKLPFNPPPRPNPGLVLNPPPIPPNPGVGMLLENGVFLNGLATPDASVTWDLNPTPTPPAPVPVVALRLDPNPVPNPLAVSPVPSPPPSPVFSGCCELKTPSPVGCVPNPDPPSVELNPFDWLWFPEPRFIPGVPNPPSPPRVVAVGSGEETVGLGRDPNCPLFSAVAAGVVGPDPGIGGKLSSNEAPNDDDGLKVFKPVNFPSPVVCEISPPVGWAEIGGAVEVVTPVG